MRKKVALTVIMPIIMILVGFITTKGLELPLLVVVPSVLFALVLCKLIHGSWIK